MLHGDRMEFILKLSSPIQDTLIYTTSTAQTTDLETATVAVMLALVRYYWVGHLWSWLNSHGLLMASFFSQGERLHGNVTAPSGPFQTTPDHTTVMPTSTNDAFRTRGRNTFMDMAMGPK